MRRAVLVVMPLKARSTRRVSSVFSGCVRVDCVRCRTEHWVDGLFDYHARVECSAGDTAHSGEGQATMALSPAELAHRALYAAPDVMVLIDASGVIRFANRQVIAVFGYGLETVIGKSMAELVPQFCRAGYIARDEKSLGELGVRAVGAQVNQSEGPARGRDGVSGGDERESHR